MIKKQLSQILLLVLLLLIMVGLYLPIRRNVVAQLEHIKETLISNWEREYDMVIKYRSASPTIINSLRIRDFSLTYGEREKLNFSFNSERISCFYGLRPFSREGRKISLNRILIKRGIVYVNLPPPDPDAPPADMDEITSRAVEIISSYFPSAVVELRDINVRIVYSGDIYNWNISLLRCDAGEEGISVNHKGYVDARGEIAFAVAARGSIGASLDLLNLSAELSDFQSPYLLFDQLDFQIGMNNGELRVSKVSDKFPVDISLMKTGNIWAVNYQSEDFTPSQIFSPGEEWKRFEPWFRLSLDGSLQGRYDGERGIPSYESDLTVKGNNRYIDDYLGGYSRAKLVLKGEESHISGETIELDSPLGNFSYSGEIHLADRKSRGRLMIRDLALPSDLTLDADLNMNLDDTVFSVNSDSLAIGDEDGGALSLSGEAQWDNKNILANAVYSGTFADYVSLDLYADYSDKFDLKSWYEIQSLHLSRLLETAAFVEPESTVDALLLDARANSRGFIEIDGKKMNAMVDEFNLTSPRYSLSAKGYGNESKVVLSDLLFENEAHRIVGSFIGNLGEEDSLDARLAYNGNPYDFHLLWQKEERLLTLTGSYGIEGDLRYYDSGMVHFNLASASVPLVWQENKLAVKLGMSGMISQGKWSVSLLDNRLSIISSPYIYPAQAVFSGILDNGTLHVNKLVWKDEFSRIRGNGKILLPLAGSTQFNGWLTMDSDKNEKYKFLFFKDGSHYNGYGDIENFIVKRVKAVDREGTISAQLNFEDIPRSSKIKGSLSAAFEDWGNLACSLDLNDERALLTEIRGEYGATLFDSGLLTLNRESGAMTMSLGMGGTLAKKDWRTGLYIKGSSEDLFHPEKANFNGVLKTEEISFNGSAVSPPLSFRVERSGDDFSLYNDDRSVWNSYYNFSTGQLVVNTEKLLPLSFDLRGVLREDLMDLTVSRISMDMSKANVFMPVDYASKKAMVEFDQGTLQGDITLEGTWKAPRINGVLTIDPMKLNTAYSTKDKGLTRAAIDITENNITIPYFEMSVGQTGTIGAKGSVMLNNWNLEEFRFDFSLMGKNGGAVAMIYPIKGLALNGEAEGNVSFYGTGRQYFITGEILMDRLVMSLAQTPRKPRIPRNERPDPWDLNVDVSFITGKDVSIAVPNEDFHVVKAQLDIDQKLRYQLDNIPWEFTFTGDLSIRSGDIAYFDKSFDLTEGRITFEEDQESFDPSLDITAETTLMNQGDEVTLIIDYEGSLFGEFDPHFSSIPAYSEREILAMLEPFQTEGDNSALAMALGSYADRYTFSAPFEEGLKDALNVDMVTIETGFLKNIIEDQLNAGQGVYTNESSQYNVARYLDDTYLNLGKYLGRDLFVAGGLSVNYDERRTVMNGMSFDFNVTLEMETPFFNIGWTYLPDDLNSRNSSDGFISDSSITINFRL